MAAGRRAVRRSAALLLLPLAAGCVAVPSAEPPRRDPVPARPSPQQPPPSRPQQPPPQGFVAPQVLRLAGLERVIERDATALLNTFGPPRLDVREGDMRKLQFAGEACVLDVFLYPLRPGAEPVATHVEARRPSDGLDVDRAACAAALARR
jgi:hypothetical protein